MKRIFIIILLGIEFIISLICLFLLNYNGKFIYSILLCALSIFIGASFFTLYYAFKSDKALYKKHLNLLLNEYKEILIESTTLPNLDDKKIIIVGSMEELYVLQKHLKKSVYYKKEHNCCSFFLLDSDEACIYILKVNDGVVSNLENIMEEINKKRSSNKVFSIIDKNVVIKLENSRSFKISGHSDKIEFDDEKKES